MIPNNRRHDEYAPHPSRAVAAPLAPSRGPAQGQGTAQPQRRSRGRRKRTQPERPANLTEQPEVRSAVEAALAEDDSVAAGDE